MSGSVVATVQRKGGVGKTTISVCLAGELYSRGHEVTLVDADPQRSASHWATPNELLFKVRDVPFHREHATAWLKETIGHATDDFTIVDSASNEDALKAAVLCAKLVLLPCTPSGLDIEATMDALYFVNCVRDEYHLDIDVLLVPNRIDLRTLEGQQFLDTLAGMGEEVAPPLGHRTAYVRSFTSGRSVNRFAPGSVADEEIKILADLVEDRCLSARHRQVG